MEMTKENLIKNEEREIILTMREILNSNDSLLELSREKYPVFTAFRIARTLRLVGKFLDDFTDKRKVVLDEFGTEKDGRYTYEGENEKLASDKINAFLDEEVSLKIAQVKISEVSSAQLEPRIFAILNWLFIED